MHALLELRTFNGKYTEDFYPKDGDERSSLPSCSRLAILGPLEGSAITWVDVT